MHMIVMILVGFVIYVFIGSAFYWSALRFEYKRSNSEFTFKDWLASTDDISVILLGSTVWPFSIILLILYYTVVGVLKVTNAFFKKIFERLDKIDKKQK